MPVDVRGTVRPKCACGECTITLSNDGGTSETLQAGDVSTCVFGQVGVEEIVGECESVRIETVQVTQKFSVGRWDT